METTLTRAPDLSEGAATAAQAAPAPGRSVRARAAAALSGTWSNLSTRVALAVALGALLVMALAHFMHVRLLDDEMGAEIGKQLLATAARAADDVDGRIERRTRALAAVAFEIFSEPRRFDRAGAQDFLNHQGALLSMFEHLMFVAADGSVLADRPRVAGVRGLNIGDREYFRRARDTSRLAVSEPLRSRAGDFTVIAMAVPVLAPDGSFGGVLVGSLNLVRSGLFADMRDAQIGDSGYFAAVSLSGTVVMHPDQRRVLRPADEVLVAPGLRRALVGWSGWQQDEIEGVPSLAAYKRLRNVPWVVMAVQPKAEAFAALARVDRVLAGGRAAAVALLALFAWLVTARALIPLERLRAQIDELEAGRRVGSVDEHGSTQISAVASAFNRLLAKQQRLADALSEREAFHRSLNDSSPVGVFLHDGKAQLTYCNARFEQITGRTQARLSGWSWFESIHEDDRAPARQNWLAARARREGFVQEYRLVRPGGEIVWVRAHHEPVGSAGAAPEYLVAVLDVTVERETAEGLRREQQQGQMILDTISDALVVVAANGRVRDLTRAAERLVGWARDKAIDTPVGRVVRVFDAAAAPVDIAEIIDEQTFRTEDWSCETANGEPIAVELVWHRFGESLASGGVLVLRDITERRRESQRVAWAATHDALTGLANRRAFEEALAAAHAAFLRTGVAASVVMVDLDHFKQVNDRGGHDAGDEMLRLVTRVLGDSVRATDVVARLGGDEFALLLQNCATSRAAAVAEAIRSAIVGLGVVRRGVALRIGASFGVATLAESDRDGLAAMLRADAACYRAKGDGRNAVRLAEADARAAGDARCVPGVERCSQCEATGACKWRAAPVDERCA